MKKLVALLLSVVMLFSFGAVVASAAGETVTITFYDENGITVLATRVVEKGTVPEGPGAPIKGDGTEWKFDGWVKADGSDSEKYYSGTLPAANEDTAYKATYVKLYDDSEEELTLMGFLTSIFARLNKIFVQIATYFEELTASISALFD